jgi:hypothetical protein
MHVGLNIDYNFFRTVEHPKASGVVGSQYARLHSMHSCTHTHCHQHASQLHMQSFRALRAEKALEVTSCPHGESCDGRLPPTGPGPCPLEINERNE